MSPRANPERLDAVLARIACELDEVALRIDANQAAIAAAGPVLLADPVRVAAMQDADLCAQRVAGVAGFVRAVAEASSGDWHLDTMPASNALTLAALMARIGNPAAAGAAAGSRPQPGDVDLF